jgi:hypothetical protein
MNVDHVDHVPIETIGSPHFFPMFTELFTHVYR